MVASIVLYDHVDPAGAFCKKSPISVSATSLIDVRFSFQSFTYVVTTQIKKSVAAIKDCPDQDTSSTLLNTLQYSTKHLRDADTPSGVTSLFE